MSYWQPTRGILQPNQHWTRPRVAGSSDAAETTAFLVRTSGLDGAHTSAYQALINGMVADGDFASFDAIYMFATQDATNACLNLCSSSNTAVNHSAVFTANAGFAGPYVDTTVNPTTTSKFTQDSAHFSGWWNSSTSSNPSGRHGYIDGGATKGTYIGPGDASAQAAININSGFDNLLLSSAAGHQKHYVLGNRSASNARQIYLNGTSDGTDAATSTTIPAGATFWIGSRNFGGSTNQSSDVQCMMSTIGASLPGAAAARVYARFHSYLQTIVGIP